MLLMKLKKEEKTFLKDQKMCDTIVLMMNVQGKNRLRGYLIDKTQCQGHLLHILCLPDMSMSKNSMMGVTSSLKGVFHLLKSKMHARWGIYYLNSRVHDALKALPSSYQNSRAFGGSSNRVLNH